MNCRGVLAVAVFLLSSAASCVAAGDESPGRAEDEQAIVATSKEYIAAIARGDSKALAEFWMPQGDVIDETGRLFSAQELIDEEAKAVQGGPRPEVNVTIRSIRFLTADVAIEDGASEVTPAASKAPPARGRFSAIWVKHDGKWRLATLREARIGPPSGAAAIADLDGMIGEWSAQDGDETIEVSAHWNSNHTFLMRGLKLAKGGKVVFSGLQRIGWDAASQKIKSFMYDSEGGRSEGIWAKHGDSWTVETTGVTPDGKRSSSTNTYTPDGQEGLTWTSTTTAKNGESKAGVKVKLVRKPATQ